MNSHLMKTAVQHCIFTLWTLAIMGVVPSPARSDMRVLGPYISAIDTATPLVVLHTENETTVRAVMMGEPAGLLRRDASTGRHHVFELPAEPDIQRVRYGVQINGEEQWHEWTRPDQTESEYAFVVVGDAQNSRSPERRTRVMNALEAHEPAFIIHTGDLHVGKGGARDSHDLFGEDWRINFFDPMPQIQTRIPFFPVFGNHDDELEGQRESFYTAFPNLPENGCYHFAHGPVAFFFLDIQNQIREFFRKGQDTWLREAVSQYPDALWRVAVFHVSPWSGGHRGERDWTIGQREQMLETFQELGIDLVFCGHDHNYQRMRPLSIEGASHHPVQVVISGLAGSNYYDANEQEYTVKVVNRQDHFCHIAVSPDQLAVQVITTDGEELDAFVIHHQDRRIEPTVQVYTVPAP